VDQSIVDTDIPFRLGGFSATTIQVFSVIIVMINATWQVVFVFVPVVIISVCVQVNIST
jgi:hypothetical protein